MYDDPLRIIAEHEGGIFLYREAIEAGYKDKQVQAMRRSGRWRRVRHGAYCFADTWALLTPAQRHLTLAHAVRRTTPGSVVFSHTTALVAHGIDVWGADLGVAHVTRLDTGASRVVADVRQHVAKCTDEEVTEAHGLLVTTPARATLEAGTILDTQSALTSFDSAVWQGLCTIAELKELFEKFANHWPGSRHLHVALRLATGKSETVGESRSMYLFWLQHLPAPEQQWEIKVDGKVVAIIDFAWPQFNLFGEFDGKGKYLRPYRPGEDPGEVVFREKTREDLVRRLTGFVFVRIIWADLYHPARTAAYIRSMMRVPA
jgi:hypothetical protein